MERSRYRQASVLALLLLSAPAAALTVESYREMKTQLSSTDVMDANIARLTLAGYTQGAADALAVQRGGENRRIPVSPGVSICLPPSVVLSADLVKAALDQELDGHAELWSAPHWQKAYATNLAMIGLARMFPCDEAR